MLELPIIYRRFSEHNFSDDKKSYTYTRRPVKLLFHQEFKDINKAISFENKLKGWSRLKKEAVINGERQKLPELSKCYNNTRYDR